MVDYEKAFDSVEHSAVINYYTNKLLKKTICKINYNIYNNSITLLRVEIIIPLLTVFFLFFFFYSSVVALPDSTDSKTVLHSLWIDLIILSERINPLGCCPVEQSWCKRLKPNSHTASSAEALLPSFGTSVAVSLSLWDRLQIYFPT